MTSSRLIPLLGNATCIAGLYGLQSKWNVPTLILGAPVHNEEMKEPRPAFAMARTASERAKQMADSAQKAHTTYCEKEFGNPDGSTRKIELKRSLSKIHTNM